jgi:cytidylate kinase
MYRPGDRVVFDGRPCVVFAVTQGHLFLDTPEGERAIRRGDALGRVLPQPPLFEEEPCSTLSEPVGSPRSPSS